MKFIKFLLAFAVYVLWPVSMIWASEDIDTQTSTIVLSIPAACHLLINDPDQTKTLDTDIPLEAAFEAGYAEFDSAKPTLTISANKSWKLSVKSSGFAVNGAYQKATEDLQLKDASSSGNVKNGFNNYKALLETDQEMASNLGGVKAESHPLQYRILLDYTKDIPGTYTATVTYTLATQS